LAPTPAILATRGIDAATGGFMLSDATHYFHAAADVLGLPPLVFAKSS
jgi:hypothetical protein